MSETSPYKLFFNWCFDGFKDTPIPNPEILLKYNSPINETFLIKMFIQNGKLNNYLDTHFNNIGLRYIDKEDRKKVAYVEAESQGQATKYFWQSVYKAKKILLIALIKKA